MRNLIDTHCHLQLAEFDVDRERIIKRAKRRGVDYIIVPGIDLTSSQKAVALARQFPHFIYSAVGIHPYGAVQIVDIEGRVKQIENLVKKTPVVAIGEIGLDYQRYQSNEIKYRQQLLFRAQLQLAQKHNLPVIIHCREAWEDLITIVSEINPRGVVHCFSGGRLHLLRILKLGLSIGVDGNITYSKILPTVLAGVPLERVFVETDAPYLTPVPHRGERNEPGYLTYVIKSLAKLFTISKEEVAKATTHNAKRLFGLSLNGI